MFSNKISAPWAFSIEKTEDMIFILKRTWHLFLKKFPFISFDRGIPVFNQNDLSW